MSDLTELPVKTLTGVGINLPRRHPSTNRRNPTTYKGKLYGTTRLTTLKGAPKEVGCNFYCEHNQLITLKGAPEQVGGNFYCDEHLNSDPEYKKHLIRKKLSNE